MMKLIILLSGFGSNCQAIIDAIASQQLQNCEIKAVISNKKEAYGLKRAITTGIPTHTVLACDYPEKAAFDAQLLTIMQGYAPDLIVLAGFMRLLGKAVVDAFAGRIINIHPSLLPKYRGLNTHARVLAAGDKIHGSSVHFVTHKLDSGPVIAQANLPVDAEDTPAHLEARIKHLEHQLYPLVLEWFADNRIHLDASGVVLLDGKPIGKQGIQCQFDT